MNEWYKKQNKVTQFAFNVFAMSLFLAIILCLLGLYLSILFYVLHMTINVSGWYGFLIPFVISIPIGFWFAIDMLKEEYND